MNSHQRKHVATLERRRQTLVERLNRWEGKHGSDSWTRRELSSVVFALDIISRNDEAGLLSPQRGITVDPQVAVR